MAKAVIQAGVCGFVTEVEATSDDMATATLRITSGCPAYAHMKEESYEVDALSSCFGKIGEDEVYALFRPTCKHAACPVPSGALKAVEVACGLALPHDVSMTLSK